MMEKNKIAVMRPPRRKNFLEKTIDGLTSISSPLPGRG
jgi:hypothetical protein